MCVPTPQNHVLHDVRLDDATAIWLPIVYDELRNLAHVWVSRRDNQTLQATELVHEAYERLADKTVHNWQGRAHFFYASARAMRDVLVDRARKKASLKRGGGRQRVDLQKLQIAMEAPAEDLLAFDQVLENLKERSQRQHDMVILRYFVGLTLEETAEILQVSERTLRRDWTFAQAWLHKELSTFHDS